jgi:hypothetical protein
MIRDWPDSYSWTRSSLESSLKMQKVRKKEAIQSPTGVTRCILDFMWLIADQPSQFQSLTDLTARKMLENDRKTSNCLFKLPAFGLFKLGEKRTPTTTNTGCHVGLSIPRDADIGQPLHHARNRALQQQLVFICTDLSIHASRIQKSHFDFSEGHMIQWDGSISSATNRVRIINRLRWLCQEASNLADGRGMAS